MKKIILILTCLSLHASDGQSAANHLLAVNYFIGRGRDLVRRLTVGNYNYDSKESFTVSKENCLALQLFKANLIGALSLSSKDRDVLQSDKVLEDDDKLVDLLNTLNRLLDKCPQEKKLKNSDNTNTDDAINMGKKFVNQKEHFTPNKENCRALEMFHASYIKTCAVAFRSKDPRDKEAYNRTNLKLQNLLEQCPPLSSPLIFN